MTAIPVHSIWKQTDFLDDRLVKVVRNDPQSDFVLIRPCDGDGTFLWNTKPKPAMKVRFHDGGRRGGYWFVRQDGPGHRETPAPPEREVPKEPA